MSLIIPPRIPAHARRFEVTVGAEIPDRTLTWIDDTTDLPIQFATQPHTFEFRIDLYTGVYLKTTGIVGNDGDPNVLISFTPDELIGLQPGHYHAQLHARRISDGKDWEPIDFRFVVFEAVALSGPPLLPSGDSIVPGDLTVLGSMTVGGDPLPGTELDYAERVSNFATTQEYANAEVVPDLSITFEVPNRPYVVTASGGIVPSVTGHGIAFGIWNVDDDQELVHGASGGISQQIAIDVTPTIRVPNAFHTPTPGTMVTYECRLFVTAGSALGTLIAGNFFGTEYVASLRAYVT